MGDYQGATEGAQKAKPLLWTSEWHIQLVDYCFYSALAILTVHETTAPKRKAKRLPDLKKNRERLREWAENCPANFLDKYNLVMAEVARTEGRDFDAMRLYEEAMRTALCRTRRLQMSSQRDSMRIGATRRLQRPIFGTRGIAIFVGAHSARWSSSINASPQSQSRHRCVLPSRSAHPLISWICGR